MSQELFNIREWQTTWFANAMSQDRPETQFETWFQPIVDTTSRTVLGHECFVRLRAERDRRIYNGSQILDAARNRNEIRAFDSYARALAVKSAGLQRHLGRRNPAAQGPFFVNFLPASIPASMNGTLEAMRPVMETLSATGLRPADFIFEVVDADLVGDSARLRRIQDYIRGQGFGFALDNVGIGANPMQSLTDLRPDYIKIDPRVCWNIEQPIYAATVRMLVEVADRMGVHVIACGVEKTRTVENLWLLGVEVMQGHLFGRPSPDVAQTATIEPVESMLSYQMPDSDLMNLARALTVSNPIQPAKPAPEVGHDTEYHQDIFLIHSNANSSNGSSSNGSRRN